METPSQTVTKTASRTPIQARTPKQASAGNASVALPRERRFRGGALLLAALMLIVGIAIGAYGMRARYSSREVIAAVNGQTIDKEEFFLRLQQASGKTVLRTIVGEKLQDQFSEKQHARTPKSEVDTKYAEISKQPNFMAMLSDQLMTPSMFKDRLRRGLDRINALTKGVNVTDAEVQTFYKLHTDPRNPQARFYTPEAIEIACIITPSQADARKARLELLNGADFKTMVEKYSKDTSSVNEGVLPPIFRGRTKFGNVKGMEDALFRMKVGEVSDPQKFAGAYWIIRCLDKIPVQKKSFEEVKDEARVGAALTKGLPGKIKKVEEEFLQFQKAAKVQAFWPQYKEAVIIGGVGKK